MSPNARRIASEIEVFARQGRLHAGNPAMDWRNTNVVGPATRAALGADGVHAFYAQRIHDAITRTGATTVLSIGCGSGHEEIETLRHADRMCLPPFAITGLELSPVTAERANRLAHEAGLAHRFHVAVHDLNNALPNCAPVAAVMAHHVLHHVVALEAMYSGIAKLLHPHGALLTYDMIGRNGHQRWPEVAPLVRAIWRAVPVGQRYDHVFRKPMPHWQDWDCAIEGFEGVRAQEVLPLLAQYFVPERFVAWGGLMDAFVNDRTGPCFDPTSREADRIFLERLAALEAELLERCATTPTEMGGEFRRADSGFGAAADVAAAFARALRDPAKSYSPVPPTAFDCPWPVVEDVPDVLPVRPLDYAALAAAGALEDGWDAEGWAILSEHGLDLRFAEPVRALRIQIWHNLPASRLQFLDAVLEGETILKQAPLQPRKRTTLMVVHPSGGNAAWRLRLFSTAYRQPDEDGGPDRRPLAWKLGSVEPLTDTAGTPAFLRHLGHLARRVAQQLRVLAR